MIPFASQRGSGQDLATHLLNEHDNEVMEVAEIRGAIAPDLHGAFTEWEAQAHGLTQCKKYLYSLSINPDPKQDPLTRDDYLDYIQRTEDKLGLTDQPRAIVFHNKYGREHCHVVWSRIDADQEKAVQLSFDREKLMMVTREFARDHGLSLPAGYQRNDKDGRGEQSGQLSLYDMHQQRTTGFSKEEHQDFVTDCWRSSDSPKAFIQALAEKGYLLATGKRPYVLVDFYGGMHALPKLIADKSVRTKDIRAYLEKDYPSDSLPSVDEAKEQIAKHRAAIETHAKAENYNEALADLERAQETRRSKLEIRETTLRQTQHKARLKFTSAQKEKREDYRAAYRDEVQRVNDERAKQRQGKLAKLFGKLSGVSKLRKAMRKYQDRKRTKTFQKLKAKLKDEQFAERLALARRQEMQTLDMGRKLSALGKLEKRELKGFKDSMKRDARDQARSGRDQIPSLFIGKDKEQKQKSTSKVQSYRRSRKRDRDDNDRGR